MTATYQVPTQSTAAVGTSPAVGMSVEAAARALGVSINTVRRRVKTGELRSERVRRPQGYAIRVYLPTQVPAAGTCQEVPAHEDVPNGAAAPAHQVPTDVQRAEALAAYGATLLAPVLADLERLQRENRDQAEQIGRLTAELEAARAAGSVSRDTDSPRPWWRFWRRR
jgi:excisionase family DNA binding protein